MNELLRSREVMVADLILRGWRPARFNFWNLAWHPELGACMADGYYRTDGTVYRLSCLLNSWDTVASIDLKRIYQHVLELYQ